MMTSAQVFETSVNVTSNSPSQDYTHRDDHNLQNYGIYYVALDGMLVSRIITLVLLFFTFTIIKPCIKAGKTVIVDQSF